MSSRTQLVTVFACILAALGLVGYQVFRPPSGRTYAPGTTFAEGARLAELSTNGVRVVIFMEADSQGQPLLRATFTPIDRGFHVYSKDLDPKTTGGVGLATRLELLPHVSVRSAGQLFADIASQSHPVKELGTSVEIYPDGPVTLRLPIRIVEATTNLTAQVAVSYMACKTDGVCLPPVEREVLDVRVAAR